MNHTLLRISSGVRNGLVGLVLAGAVALSSANKVNATQMDISSADQVVPCYPTGTKYSAPRPTYDSVANTDVTAHPIVLWAVQDNSIVGGLNNNAVDEFPSYSLSGFMNAKSTQIVKIDGEEYIISVAGLNKTRPVSWFGGIGLNSSYPDRVGVVDLDSHAINPRDGKTGAYVNFDAGDFLNNSQIQTTCDSSGAITSINLFSKQFLPGDANRDGSVAFADYQRLEAGFGNPGILAETWSQGDFDGDGNVAFADYQLLEANFGKSSVPEPATLSLLTLGGLGLAYRGKRRARLTERAPSRKW
jgi:hypothetical protein